MGLVARLVVTAKHAVVLVLGKGAAFDVGQVADCLGARTIFDCSCHKSPCQHEAPCKVNLNDTIAEKAIEKATAYALKNKLAVAEVKEIAAGTRASCRDNPCHTMHLPMGVTAVYSIEEHPGGWFNKVYVSVSGSMPQREVAYALAIHISRPHGPKKIDNPKDVLVYAEPDGTGINVLIPFVEPSRIITVNE